MEIHQKCRNCIRGVPRMKRHRIVQDGFSHFGGPGFVLCLLCRRVFECPLCRRNRETKKLFKKLTCRFAVCRMVASTPKQRRWHQRVAHSNELKYACSECDREFKDKSYLEPHFEHCHANLPVRSYPTAAFVKAQDSFTLLPGETIHCFVPRCTERLLSSRGLLYHLNEVHKNASRKEIEHHHRKAYNVGRSYLRRHVAASKTAKCLIRRIRCIQMTTLRTTKRAKALSTSDQAGYKLIRLHRRLSDDVEAAAERHYLLRNPIALSVLRQHVRAIVKSFEGELNIVWAINRARLRAHVKQTIRLDEEINHQVSSEAPKTSLSYEYDQVCAISEAGDHTPWHHSADPDQDLPKESSARKSPELKTGSFFYTRRTQRKIINTAVFYIYHEERDEGGRLISSTQPFHLMDSTVRSEYIAYLKRQHVRTEMQQQLEPVDDIINDLRNLYL